MDFKLKCKKCSEWTIPELKKALMCRKEKTSGKKQDLCIRLKESLKHPIRNSKKQMKNKLASVKILPIDIHNSLFIFYSTLYYQKPMSQMAINYLSKYGLTKNKLDKYKNYNTLWNNLK